MPASLIACEADQTRMDSHTSAYCMPGPDFAQRVIAWQRSAGRHGLPWQNSRDPYKVWLSEIMLQQTQVVTVLGYYERFLDKFPDVRHLAQASLDEVLALWSGLGYYGRARNLHRCAQVVVDKHGGKFPPSAARLAELPGIGASTAAAIAAFCFGEHVAILDGNVKRVLSRCLAFDGDLALAGQQRLLWEAASRLLPKPDLHEDGTKTSIAAYTQGMMDLGATICSLRAPACHACPLREDCLAARNGNPERYPTKTRRLKRNQRRNHWFSLVWRDQMWLVQRPAEGIWAGLWSLCEFDSAADLASLSATWPGFQHDLPSFKHVLTHLDWHLSPVQHQLPDSVEPSELATITSRLPQPTSGRWFPREEVPKLGLPAALRKILPLL